MREALRITKELSGKDHPDYLIRLSNLARLCKATGRYGEAEKLFLAAIASDKEKSGTNGPQYGLKLTNLAELYQLMGRDLEAEALVKEALESYIHFFNRNCGYLSEKELKQFLETFLGNLDFYQSVLYLENLKGSDNGGVSMDIELFRKGLLLRSVLETRKSILESKDTALINRYNTFIAFRKQASELSLLPRKKQVKDPDLLIERAGELEKELTLLSRQYRKSSEENTITWEKIQDRLNPGEALVEFTGFRFYNKKWSDSTFYCAILLRKDDKQPKIVYLCEEKQLGRAAPSPGSNPSALDLAYHGGRGMIIIPDSGIYLGGELYSLVWQPFDTLLKNIHTEYYSPSGLTSTLSFAAIPSPEGKLLSEKFRLVQVSSARTLVADHNEMILTDLALFGGINYKMDTTEMLAESIQYSKPGNTLLAYQVSRTGNLSGFEHLENTLVELKEIKAKMEEKKLVVRTFTGSAAVEESFMNISGKESPVIIHIATHGFYYPYRVVPQQIDKGNFTEIGQERFSSSEDPLLRSGLAFAGANRTWTGKSIRRDWKMAS